VVVEEGGFHFKPRGIVHALWNPRPTSVPQDRPAKLPGFREAIRDTAERPAAQQQARREAPPLMLDSNGGLGNRPLQMHLRRCDREVSAARTERGRRRQARPGWLPVECRRGSMHRRWGSVSCGGVFVRRLR
jgi:hypothetical protein